MIGIGVQTDHVTVETNQLFDGRTENRNDEHIDNDKHQNTDKYPGFKNRYINQFKLMLFNHFKFLWMTAEHYSLNTF